MNMIKIRPITVNAFSFELFTICTKILKKPLQKKILNTHLIPIYNV